MGDGSAETGQHGLSQSAAPHPSFRLAEKHFKNRSTRALPPLKDLPSSLCLPVLDLSRPQSLLKVDDLDATGLLTLQGSTQPVTDVSHDEVWAAGWWARTYGDPRKRIGETGERPPIDYEGITETTVNGRKAFVVAEGEKATFPLTSGCILVPSYLSPPEQEQLVLSALSNYTLPPNPLSVDVHYATPPNLFELYATAPDTPVLPRHTDIDDDERVALAEKAKAATGLRQTVTTPATATPTLDTMLTPAPADTMSVTAKPRSVGQLFSELRWANLGWIYRWTTKAYDFSQRIAFPVELGNLCRSTVRSALDNYGDYGEFGEDQLTQNPILASSTSTS